MSKYSLKIKVTKDILKKSMNCHGKGQENAGNNCAIAVAVREIFPNAFVRPGTILPFGITKENVKRLISNVEQDIIRLPKKVSKFITEFDKLRDTPLKRVNLPEIEFEVEILQSIIDKIDISDGIKTGTVELVKTEDVYV